MRAPRRAAALLLGLLGAAPLGAQGTPTGGSIPPVPAPMPPRLTLRVTGDLGFVSTGGNTSVQTLNLGDKIVAKMGKTTGTQQFSVVHGRSKGKTVTSLWRSSFRLDYALPSVFGSYTSLQYERNTFSGLRSRVITTAGLTAHVVRQDRQKFSLEGGITLTAQRNVDAKKPDLDALGGRAALIYHRKIGSASVSQNVELLPNFRESEKFRANTESAITAPITKQVGLKMSFQLRYDGAPSGKYQHTDRFFTSGITFSF